jgi:fatty-acyl-CoA synthase
VISGERRVNYRELHERSQCVATAFAACGIRRGDRIGLLMGNQLEWLEACLGAGMLGALVIPFSTWSKQRELDFLLRDSRVRMLVTVDRFGEQDYLADLAALIPEATAGAPGDWHSNVYPDLEQIVVVGENGLAGASHWSPKQGAEPSVCSGLDKGAQMDDPALILYTSGSSAHPKAVPLHHGSMIENGFNIGERQGLQPGEPVLLAPPLFWSYGSANAMCATFTHGATLVLQARFDPAEAIDLIERHRCRSIYTLPSITSAIVTHPAFRPERTQSLRTGLTIGSPNDVSMAAEVLGAREICNVYGQTESYGNCAVTWHHWPLERRKRVHGPPLPGVTIRIVSPDDGRALPAGSVGYIEVSGYLTPGYVGASAGQNEDAFTADGFFRTGDLGLITAEGDVQFIGRDTEMIKRGGINIAPAEVEDVLQQHPAIARAGVAGAADPTRGEVIVAFVVPFPGVAISEEMLRQHCRRLAIASRCANRCR